MHAHRSSAAAVARNGNTASMDLVRDAALVGTHSVLLFLRDLRNALRIREPRVRESAEQIAAARRCLWQRPRAAEPEADLATRRDPEVATRGAEADGVVVRTTAADAAAGGHRSIGTIAARNGGGGGPVVPVRVVVKDPLPDRAG
jgi:hypothetical protein